MSNHGPLKVFACNSGTQLANRICEILLIDEGQILVGRFSDGEVRVKIKENVRGGDCYVVVALCPPAENFLEMYLTAAALKASSAERITLVITYLGYNRQDRKDEPRVPFSAHKILQLIAISGADRCVFMNVHSEPTLGILNVLGMGVDHLFSSVETIPYIRTLIKQPFAIASPDKGGGPQARFFANRLGLHGYVAFDKARPQAGSVEESSIVISGEVAGKNILFPDDMVDTGKTLAADVKEARKKGAERILACATHALLSDNALARLDDARLDELIITDTIFHPSEELRSPGRMKVTVISVAELLAKAIRSLHENESISKLIE